MSELKNYINNTYKDLKLYNPFFKLNKNSMPLDLKVDIDGFISEDKKLLDLVCLRALNIFNELFDENDEIFFVINKYDNYDYDIVETENGKYDTKYLYDNKTYTQDNIRINPYIKNKSILKKFNSLVTNLGKTSEVGIKNVHNYYVSCTVRDIRYKTLIRELIEHEIINNFKGMADYYIVHKQNKYVYHLCDDEWIDLSFKEDDDFEKFNKKYYKYISY